jgi:hypothetical protein
MTTTKSAGREYIGSLLGNPKPTGSLVVESINPSDVAKPITDEYIILRQALKTKFDEARSAASAGYHFPGWDLKVEGDGLSGTRVVFNSDSDTTSSAVAIIHDSKTSGVSVISERAALNNIPGHYQVKIQRLDTTPDSVVETAELITIDRYMQKGTIVKIDHIEPFTVDQWNSGLGELALMHEVSKPEEPSFRAGVVNWFLGL